jgi:hypothetical protein
MTGAALGSAIAVVLADSDGEPLLERDVFGTTASQRIATLVDSFCRERLGAGVAGYELFATSYGSVHGVRLRDRRRVVVKAYRREIDLAHLAAVQHAQAHVPDGGFPAPRPLLAPAPLARGVAVMETLRDRGARRRVDRPARGRAKAAHGRARRRRSGRRPGRLARRAPAPSSPTTRPRAAPRSATTHGERRSAASSPRWRTPPAASTPTGSQPSARDRRRRSRRLSPRTDASASSPARANDCCRLR